MHIRDYVGDRNFYKKLIVLLIPLVLQQSLSSVVNLLDNVMVGQLGQESFSGVAIVNQLMFVFNLTVCGAMAGAAIFGAQYHGIGSPEGVRYSYRFRFLIGVGLAVVGIIVFLAADGPLIRLYLNGEGSEAGDLELAFAEAKDYLKVCLWGILPFVVATALSSALRDTGETFMPMVAGILAIVVNVVLNYVLIFDHFGHKGMGVGGAALATVISRYVECGFLLWRSHKLKERFPFLQGAYKSMYVPMKVVGQITKIGWPLLINEFLWSISNAFINQCYSMRGLDAVTATNICGTAWQIFSIVMMAMGSAIAILVGQQLGSGDKVEARRTAYRLMAVNLVAHLVMGAAMAAMAGVVPKIYEVSDTVREMASQMLILLGCLLPVDATVHASYFIMRSGGKTFLTFLFDCGFSWCVSLTLAFALSRYTDLSIVWIYGIVTAANVLKAVGGLIIVRSNLWLNTMVEKI